MKAIEPDNFKEGAGVEGGHDKGHAFSAPLGGATSGRLVFSSGAAGVTLNGDATLSDLARGTFVRHIPYVRRQEGTVTIHYRGFPFLDWLLYARQPVARITLNALLPWEIEFSQGVSRFVANLPGLQLRSLDVLGGASDVRLALSEPAGMAYIYVAGGASRLSIHRPPTVCARLQVHGGASSLAFDEREFEAIGGEVHLKSPGFSQATSRYDVSIAGGASNVTIGYGVIAETE